MAAKKALGKAAPANAPGKASAAAGNSSKGFSAEERAAMKEYAQELKSAERRASSGDKSGEEGELLAKVAEMPEPDRAKAERIHAIVKAVAPHLTARTWYGMPAYAKDGNVVCFFQSSRKFKTRYATLGFSDKARLDDGPMWPTAFAINELNASVEARITELVKKAAS